MFIIISLFYKFHCSKMTNLFYLKLKQNLTDEVLSYGNGYHLYAIDEVFERFHSSNIHEIIPPVSK